MSPCLRFLLALVLAVAMPPLLGLARRSLRRARRSLRLARAVGRAWASGFDTVKPGPVALRGRALAIEPLLSPETGRRGVYLAYSADHWAVGAAIGSIAGHWLRAEQGEEAAPFELTDGQSSLLVDPRGAQVLRVAPLSLELTQPDGALVRYREALIEEQAELVVVGHAQAHGGFEPSAGYRGHGYRLTVTDGGRGDLVIAPPHRLGASLLLQGLAQLAGLLPALAALWLLIALLFRPLLV